MSDDSHDTDTLDESQDPGGAIPFAPRRRRIRRDRRGRRRRPRLRKLRLLALLAGFGVLALVSAAFGMMMSVAADLPQIENRAEYSTAKDNSYLYDDHWRPIGILAAPNHEVIDSYGQLGTMMRDAIISVEDKGFWSESGIDLRSIARAFVADIAGKPTQGASTIPEEFVKNALNEEGNRTIFEKLREAALAFHLTHEWPKTQILTEYLNSIYFGNGAYGAESAARVYFGDKLGYNPNEPNGGGSHKGCGDPPLRSCASALSPGQAALLAGMVANPTAFDPVQFPQAAQARRDLVLQDMRAQGYISQSQYAQAMNPRLDPLPTAADIEQPAEPPAAPYFTSWLRPQILAAVGLGRGVSPAVAEYRAYYGGLKIRTTIDLPMQQAAQQAITQNLPEGPGEPDASLVAIDNKTGQVRAMVGGPLVSGQPDYDKYPFNLATAGERQPGSAFKPFTLAVALQHGYGPDTVFDSKPLSIVVPNSDGKEIYHVKNFANEYLGPETLAQATIVSDNSVFTQLGLSRGVGTKRIAKMAHAMGIRTPVSTNPAMIIGGLKVGVSALDMAHAYETLAEGGQRVYDPVLGDPKEGPIGVAQIYCPHKCQGKSDLVAKAHYRRVLPASVASTIQTMLEGVAEHGTGASAAIPGVMVAGKTGTTTDYGDAWFVGWTPQLTCAVWVGYPNGFVPMTTQFDGGPVEGGTFPAEIWRAFMVQALQIYAAEGDGGTKKSSLSISSDATGGGSGATGTSAAATSSQAGTTPTGGTSAGANGGGGGATGG
ncbi:MAG: transglycosylase domain-containing protein, partial [Solirubrobacteraceae bacterium]